MMGPELLVIQDAPGMPPDQRTKSWPPLSHDWPADDSANLRQAVTSRVKTAEGQAWISVVMMGAHGYDVGCGRRLHGNGRGRSGHN